MCYDAKQFAQLNETMTLLSKRRAQIKEAVGAMVRKGIEYVEALTDAETKLALIETLRAISEGKMFVEVERARLTKTLAGMLEAKGEAAEARKVMIETVVETLGGMGKREKTAFVSWSRFGFALTPKIMCGRISWHARSTSRFSRTRSSPT